MTKIAGLIHRVARGKHGHEHLTFDEATWIFSELLKPDADQLQLGAFLIAQRMKGETAQELAGFVRAVREVVNTCGNVKAPAGAVDLPCYAGKRRASHVHLLAALRASQSGIPVLVHGLNDISGRLGACEILQQLGVKRARELSEAQQIIESDGIVYLDISDICPNLFRLLGLRPRLGVRSCVNTVARLINPLNCTGQLNGFFHTPYAHRMAEVNIKLGQPRSLIFMGAEGEPELYADRQKVFLAQQGEDVFQINYPPAHAPVYPRQTVEHLGDLLADIRRMQEGEFHPREQAVFNRMLEAFRFASQGKLPEAWTRA